ncbi:hypothetical protein L0B70_09130 [Kaistella sp. 97-N-M2]|uniref:hypothetical protein n=1 Tax=Kaistella sp. 97-N-M2 TaxID=2908645 RepID=UPI001F3BB15B|nr:hypothetical protein [Kaistella sp. 97-N-M2]UJF29011.1 hypothetical protein L0B70_09130 [Kaistella sp. 97-N-M2]
MLIIEACGMQGEKNECQNIKSQAELYKINVTSVAPKDNAELITILNKGIKYDFIYLSSHGSDECFGNEAGTIIFSWFDFGVELCSSDCMNEDCLVMLSCCRGGLNQVAYDLFYCCNKISYVIGPRQSLTPQDMLISFNILLYNVEIRKIDPILSCEKIKLGSDIRFVCFDRLEIETDVAYILKCQSHSEQDVDELNEAKEKVNDPKVDFIPPEVLDLNNAVN